MQGLRRRRKRKIKRRSDALLLNALNRYNSKKSETTNRKLTAHTNDEERKFVELKQFY